MKKTLILLWCGWWLGTSSQVLAAAGTGATTNEFPVTEHKLSLDSHFRYFLLGPNKDVKAPAAGFGLVLILPGGAGNEEFLPFCKEMKKWGLPADCIAAELVAPKWSEAQQVVWPTTFLKEKGMTHSTEEFAEAVIDDVQKAHRIDSRSIFTLSWSSGGPAAYVVALASPRVKGSFVAMSVFKPELMPDLAKAKGRAFFLYHSPQDQVCPFFFAQNAKQLLSENGAAVTLKTYSGGHGWRPFTYYFDTTKEGIQWLRKQGDAPASAKPQLDADKRK
jgi:predicted esterase